MGAAEFQMPGGVGWQTADVVARFLPDLAIAKRGVAFDADDAAQVQPFAADFSPMPLRIQNQPLRIFCWYCTNRCFD
jgi:hypothetical protein